MRIRKSHGAERRKRKRDREKEEQGPKAGNPNEYLISAYLTPG